VALTGYNDLVTSLLPPNPILKAAFTGQAAGQMHSSLYLAGLPGAGVAPTPGLAGAALTSYAGQLAFPATSGSTTIYLAQMGVTQAGNVGAVILCDRLWHNSGIVSTTTTGQTINSVAWPPRDVNGAATGVGLMVGLEVTTATTNGSPITNTTLTYTDTGSASGNTATIASFPANAVAGTFVPFALAAGDVGLTSIQTLTLGTSYGTGVLSLVVYRQIAMIPCVTADIATALDWTQLGLPVMYNTSVPWMVYVLSGTAGGIVSASMTYAQK
jgi:hypothetical protein